MSPLVVAARPPQAAAGAAATGAAGGLAESSGKAPSGAAKFRATVFAKDMAVGAAPSAASALA